MTELLVLLAMVAFGMFAGVTAGLLGVGGGILIVPFLVAAVGMSQHEAEATSLLVVLPTALAASLSLRAKRIGDLGLALRVGLLGSLGAAGGALLALALAGETLRLLFAAFLGLVGLRLVRDAVRLRGAG